MQQMEYLGVAHKLLGLLYEQVGQQRKAVEQHRASERASTRYGFGWYETHIEYQEALEALRI